MATKNENKLGGGKTALYNAYRPTKFDDVTGQEIPVQTMRNAIKNGNVANAYLFAGPRGIGKTTTARIFAKGILCMNANRAQADGCDECESCKEFDENVNPDFLEIDAATNRGIENIRDLKNRINIAPVTSDHRVVLIDEVHHLTSDASTGLLKILEEPPAGVVFLLATTDPQKIPATIRSRCQLLRFKPLTPAEIESRLTYVLGACGRKADKEVTSMVAHRARGALRDALAMLDMMLTYSGNQNEKLTVEQAEEVLGTISTDILRDLAREIIKGDVPACVGFTARRQLDVEPKDLIAALSGLLSTALLVKICGADAALALEGVSGITAKMAEEFAKRWDVPRIQGAIDTIDKSLWKFDLPTLTQDHIFNETIAIVADPMLAPATFGLSANDKKRLEEIDEKMTNITEGLSALVDVSKRNVKQTAELRKLIKTDTQNATKQAK